MSARVHAMLLAFLLAIVVGEPLRQHECAMHLGAVATSSPDGGKDGSGAHEHGAPAMHDPASARSGSADGESPEQDAHSCDCLGTCSVVAGVRLASVTELPAAVVTLAE